MLNFLGIGSAFSPNLGNTSAYFTIDKSLFLIDCGELIFKELYNRIDFDDFKEVNIFITHNHSDHVGSLGSLISHIKMNHSIRPTVYHGGIAIEEFLTIVGISKSFYKASKVNSITIDEMVFEFVKTVHSDDIPSFGIVIDSSDRIFFYSGDSATIETNILDRFINREIDTIYQDITLDSESNSHLSLDKLIDLIPENLRSNVYAMHIDENSQDLISEYGFQIAR